MNTFKRISILIALVALASAALGQDFRGFSWGDSFEHVEKTESFAPIPRPAGITDRLMFTGTVASLDTAVIYDFLDGRLVGGTYLYDQQHTNRNSYISDYKNVLEILKRNYGEPEHDKTVWFNDLYRNRPEDHGFAVSLGHLGMLAEWETDRTEIAHMISGDNYNILLVTQYKSRQDLEAVEDAKRREQDAAF